MDSVGAEWARGKVGFNVAEHSGQKGAWRDCVSGGDGGGWS